MVARRSFGLIDPGWPAHRHGRPARPAGGPKARVERRFRRGWAVSPPQAAASPAPIHVAVTNVTLSPHFAMIWQDWNRGIKRLEQVEREVLRDTSRDVLELRLETETALARERGFRQERPESRVDRASRVFAGRILSNMAVSRPTVLTNDPLLPAGGSRDVSQRPIARHLRQSSSVAIQESQIARRSTAFLTEQAQRAFRRTELRLLQILKSTVTRRRLRFLNDDTGEQPPARSPFGPELQTELRASRPERFPAAQSSAPRQLAPERCDGPRSTGREGPSAERVLRAERSDASRSTGREKRPAERLFRAEQPAAPPASPSPVSTTPIPVPQSPPIDIAKLDTVLWQRFEKRLRIERERRGRA